MLPKEYFNFDEDYTEEDYDREQAEEDAHQAYLESLHQAEQDRVDDLIASAFMPVLPVSLDDEPF